MSEHNHSSAARGAWTRIKRQAAELSEVSSWSAELNDKLDSFLASSELLYLHLAQPTRFGKALSFKEDLELSSQGIPAETDRISRGEIWKLVTHALSRLISASAAPPTHYSRIAELIDYWDLRHQIAVSSGARATFEAYAAEAVAAALDQGLPVILRKGVKTTEASLRNWISRAFIVASVLSGVSILIAVALLWYTTQNLERSSEQAATRIERSEDRIQRTDERIQEAKKDAQTVSTRTAELTRGLNEAIAAQSELQAGVLDLKLQVAPVREEVTRLKEGKVISRVTELESVVRGAASNPPAGRKIAIRRAGNMLAERLSDVTRLAAEAERAAVAAKGSAKAAAAESRRSASSAKDSASQATKAASRAGGSSATAKTEATSAKGSAAAAKKDATSAKGSAAAAKKDATSAKGSAAAAKKDASDAAKSAADATDKATQAKKSAAEAKAGRRGEPGLPAEDPIQIPEDGTKE